MERKKPLKLVQNISESLGKLPPQAVELEETVLGAIIIETNAIVNVASILRVEHFYTEQHKEIYKAILELFASGTVIDMRTLVMHLRKAGLIELVGGATYIAELTAKISSSENIETHARILVEMGMKRALIELASQIHHDAYEDTEDVFKIIEQTNLKLQEILDHAISGRAEKTMKDVALKHLKEVEARQSGKHSGLDSGFPVVDTITNGWQKTDLIVIAARPGMGKTAFAMQSAKMIAQRGIPVGVFSLEMSDEQLFERMAVSESEIDSEKVKKGQLDPYEFKRHMEATGNLSTLPIFIDDSPMINIVELRARAMRMKAKYGIKLLVVDYLQLIKGINDGNSKMNRDQELGLITRTLKGVAKELDIPVIALAQLSRAVEQRGGAKRPQLSDLRESGSIEQDADIVTFLYRPEYYKITVTDDGMPTHGMCEVIIAKHRNGSTDDLRIKFIGKFTKFVPWIGDSTSSYVTSKRQEFGTQHCKNPTEELPNKEEDDQPF